MGRRIASGTPILPGVLETTGTVISIERSASHWGRPDAGHATPGRARSPERRQSLGSLHVGVSQWQRAIRSRVRPGANQNGPCGGGDGVDRGVRGLEEDRARSVGAGLSWRKSQFGDG